MAPTSSSQTPQPCRTRAHNPQARCSLFRRRQAPQCPGGNLKQGRDSGRKSARWTAHNLRLHQRSCRTHVRPSELRSAHRRSRMLQALCQSPLAPHSRALPPADKPRGTPVSTREPPPPAGNGSDRRGPLAVAKGIASVRSVASRRAYRDFEACNAQPKPAGIPPHGRLPTGRPLTQRLTPAPGSD
jgi:hypothetical protein